ncbi:metal-binding protein [Desulfoluna limicola]|uniref:Metal-binding protein n=1 Tax=Desulfoluna limicola TaxID=2810562 RepID=A0ABM7PN69_9BACT|nr:heavy metal-binding domain-containing protein [Desulfoluna limicola]BCS98836.1 metal-binding protein [Desulfoluna limicola]
MIELMLQNAGLLMLIVLVALGYTAGSLAEKSHYRSIVKRENELLTLPAVTLKKFQADDEIRGTMMVSGSVVISIDYFKRFLARLRNIFGGRVKSYETLVDRARREAILRMKESAPGADIIVNIRMETSTIGNSANKKKMIGSVETLAYGTAIWLRKTPTSEEILKA